MAYLLDSNVFIQAKNEYYGFNICPGFWQWLLEQNADGVVYSVDKVHQELNVGNDPLVEWINRDCGKNFFTRRSRKTEQALHSVTRWAYGQDYTDVAIRKFLRCADCHLVAHAIAGNHTIVTLEIFSNSKNHIKIPNVCKAFGIKNVTTFDMLHRENACFVLDSHDTPLC